MTPRFTSVLTLASALTLSFTFAPAARAADPAPKPEAPAKADAPKPDAATTDESAPAEAGDAPMSASQAAALQEAEAAAPKNKDAGMVADAEAGGSAVELPGQTYYGLGLRYRAIIVPKFMMNLFGDGGRTVLAHGIGPEFTVRKNAFEYDFSAWFASYAMDPTPFKASSDDRNAWEIVQSQIKILYLTADFVWSQDFTPEFAFNYGLGAGFGFVWGDLKRTQAYPGAGANDSTGAGYKPCISQLSPDATFCGDDNNHYAGYSEPNWANGGSKPVIFPWLALQTGVRYKPHRNFIARFDAGFGTSGFFLGLGADYGL